MPVITISRQLGAGGAEIASGVAKALGLRLIDGETIDRAAYKAGVPEMVLHELTYEGRRGLMEQILNALKAAPAIPSPKELRLRELATSVSVTPRGIFTPAMPLMSAAMEDYNRIVGMIIVNMAAEGNVLIVGRGSQIVLKDHPEALHTQIVAPIAARVEKLMRTLGISQREATQRIVSSDRARSDYVRRYYNAGWLDPHLYSLVLNTGRLSVQSCIQIIVTALVQRVVSDTKRAAK
jgi:CMP/dCMP kinase